MAQIGFKEVGMGVSIRGSVLVTGISGSWVSVRRGHPISAISEERGTTGRE